MTRTLTHVIETNSKDCVRSRIDGFGDCGDYLYRELSERDYGVDAIIECFEDGIPTGKIGFLQIKGTSKEIAPLKNTPCGFMFGRVNIKPLLRKAESYPGYSYICAVEG